MVNGQYSDTWVSDCNIYKSLDNIYFRLIPFINIGPTIDIIKWPIYKTE